ncbi:MAG: single-stranded-DNA-specific exonuclease RecJ [Alphaproteobacteria bacterium]|nr:single-stranded-DNA-specific exonuclease RecJ [Alphaproteobacteria bacterium]
MQENQHQFDFNNVRSLAGKLWKFCSYDERAALGFQRFLNIDELFARLLTIRKVDLKQAQFYLSPNLKYFMPDPLLLNDMDKAIGRLYQAIITGENIAVFGDYDVDGATSAALLKLFFKTLGIPLTLYIPDRFKEGYGPNIAALKKLKEQNIQVVITVDCGITSFDPLAEAAELGLDIIVIDHHAASFELPKAVAVINPNRLDTEPTLHQSTKHLAAVGVTFLLIVALNRHLRLASFYSENRPEPDLRQWLDLVALGTVCDVVPLSGLNRAFVKLGLAALAKRKNIGLTALCDIAGINDSPTSYHLGFMLGPRINAGGRIGTSDLGVKLLSSDSIIDAKQLALELDYLNKERGNLEKDAINQAISSVYSKGYQQDKPFVLASSSEWHPGIIGIIAARLKDHFNVPAFVISWQDKIGKGSARSIPDFDLGSAVIAARQEGILIEGGGHAMAAGLTIDQDKILEFEKFLSSHLLRQTNNVIPVPEIHIDGILSTQSFDDYLYDQLTYLAPFGSGNPEPKFLMPFMKIIKADIVGQNHVRCMIIGKSGRAVKAIAFRCVENTLGSFLLKKQSKLHLIGQIKSQKWQNQTTLQFIIEDAMPVVE